MMPLIKIIVFFSFAVCFPLKAYSEKSCEEIFSELDKFAFSMTEGLRLGKKQGDLFDLYKQRYFPNPRITEKGFKDADRVLNEYPELFKLPVREQYIILEEKLHDAPQSLIDFIKSFRNSAGRVRNNLFRIYENLGFWRQMLSFPKPVINPSWSKEEKKQSKRNEQEKFLEYLRKFIGPEFFKFMEDPAKDSVEKTVFMYRILSAIREDMLANGKNTGHISQAMVDLVHTSGFGNLFYTARLKSENPKEQVEAVNKILDERDSVAIALGFEDHFPELQQFLNVDHPTGFAKRENFAEILREIERDIEKMSYTAAARSSVVRVRPLSLQEAPFRSCLAVSDCSSDNYFEKALDPNFLYFTMTDESHKSSGHITVVLGAAKNVKIAFVDKIQNVSNEMILPMLESIRLSLQEQGYKLGLSNDVVGISNTGVTGVYVKKEILPKLKRSYTGFKPHENKYPFPNGYSRAYSEPKLWEFQMPEDTADFIIEPGEIKQPQEAKKDLKAETFFKEILSLQNSEKEEDQAGFINNLLVLEKIKGLDLLYPINNPVSKYRRQFRLNKRNHDFIYNYLMRKIENPENSFKLRKLAFWTLLEFLNKIFRLGDFFETQRAIYRYSDFFKTRFFDIWEIFSDEEQNILFGEMSNWRRSQDFWKRHFIERLSAKFSEGLLSKDARFFLGHRLIRLFVNFKDKYFEKAFLTAIAGEDAETVHFSVEKDINIRMSQSFAVYLTALMISVNHSSYFEASVVKTLLDIWDKFSEEEQSLLFEEISHWRNFQSFWKRRFIEDLSKRLSEGLLSKDAKLFLEHKLIRLFTNFKDDYVANAFMAAAARGDTETVDFFIQNGFDIHISNKFYYGSHYATALMAAVDSGRTETVDLLLRNGANINETFYGDSILMLAARKGHTETGQLLIQRGIDIHHVSWRGETALIAAAREGHTEFVDLLVKNGADIHHIADEGQTALSEAVRKGRAKTAQFLIKKGANRDNIHPLRYYFLMAKAFVF